MSDRRPYFGTVRIRNWFDKATGAMTRGITLAGTRGIAAHLTSDEARALADQLHDLSDRLENEVTVEPSPAGRPAPAERPASLRSINRPAYTSRTLTDAAGNPEEDLPTTQAD